LVSTINLACAWLLRFLGVDLSSICVDSISLEELFSYLGDYKPKVLTFVPVLDDGGLLQIVREKKLDFHIYLFLFEDQ
jgi:hypothetical protein